MKDKEFCLLDEGWIKVLDENLQIKEVSFCDLFTNAHRYKRLAGESATQDAAILRVLLAVAITVFYRTDAEGNEDDILESDDPEEAVLERWGEYYRKGKFNEKAFVDYLEKYRERFYLFHPQYPFWQVAELEYGTEYDIKCFVGSMKESNNKNTRHHFSVTDGDYLNELSFAEVTRWLIFLNAYAVNIKADKNAPGTKLPTGTGILGRLGLLNVNAGNIFDLIMYNLCALRNGEVWGKPKPIWELPIRTEQGIRIAPPDNLPQLYTIQSRRIKLRCVDDKVVGFNAIGGDFYEMSNDTTEQMTLLGERASKIKDTKPDVVPQKHNKNMNTWREFPSLFVDGEIRPGIVIWMKTLYSERLIKKGTMLTFRMIGLEYGDGMSYTYGDMIDDSLSMSAEFISDMGQAWVERVTEQVKKCEDVEKKYYAFAKSMTEVLYHGDSNKIMDIKKTLATRYYFLVNNAFREWLAGINPEIDDKDEKQYEWEQTSKQFAKQTIDEYIQKLDKTNALQVMNCYNRFIGSLSKLYKRKENT